MKIRNKTLFWRTKMGVNRQGIIEKKSGYITLDEHIRMPQDEEFVEDVQEIQSLETDSTAKSKRKTKE